MLVQCIRMYTVILSLLCCSIYPSLASSFAHDRVLLYSITEEIPADTFIANLLIDSELAKKYSPNIQSKLSFVFLKEIQHLELFSLDERNGILRTGQNIDRDVVCPGQLTCMIRLDLAVQPSAYFEVIKVEVSILDINDNSPTFDELRFHVVISESTPLLDRFPLPTASDVDSFSNGVVEYRLLSVTSHFQLDVKNDSMGRPKDVSLVLLRELDREESEHYELLMAAYDGGIPRRSAVLTIAVQVGDINDHSPRFERQTYNVSVSENLAIGATVARLSAVDADIGPNGHVRYRFSSRSEGNYGNLFVIDPESGDVVLLQTLNYASQNVYSLGVIAEDQGDYSVPALAALIITVVDINDHAPQIIIDALSASGSVEVRENADVATFVAHVSTFDKDGGDNGLVRCSINNSNFKLIQIYDGEYKLVAARAFDRETVSRYEVVIRCHDMGEPRMYVSKAIIVNVADVNDNHPVFTYSMYNASLQENLSWGSFVVRVSAHDPDEGANGEIAYMLDSDADQRFHIDPDSGVITTLAGLDREASELVEFHVLAANKGEHGLVSRVLIRVHVTDVDDESPKFLSDKYVFDVFENQPPRTEVGQVMAMDRDLAPFNVFSFVIHGSKTFAVDPKSGIIYAKRTLDREVEDRFEMTVEVQSSTVIIKRSVAVVVINVVDTNDNAPNITFPNEINRTVIVGSTLNVFEVVCTVRSHDSDIGVNSELSYEILEGNSTHLFGIEPVTGQVRLLKELVSYVNETFLLLIKVTDGGQQSLHSTAALYLTIVDGNQPAFGGFPRAQNQWTWLADMRLVIIAGITAICFVLIVLLVAAILLVRRRSSRHRAKTRLATVMMKNAKVDKEDAREDEDDGDSLNRMKMMMNDGKMVRMKDISYTELNSEVPSNQSSIHRLPARTGCSSGQGGATSHHVRQNVTGCPPVTFDPDTDSGCADVSHCNDDLSSGSDRSSKDIETVIGAKDRLSTSDSQRLPTSSSTVLTSGGCQYTPNPATLTVNPKSDAKTSSAAQLPCSSSAFSSSCSSSPNSSLLGCNRKSVRFADDKSTMKPKTFVNLSDSRQGEGGMRRDGRDETCSEREQAMYTDQERIRLQTFIHQYPSHTAMTTFLPDGGSLV